MLVVRSLKELRYDSNSIITIGTFDGVHLGHKSIIRGLVHRSRECMCRSAVVTFDPHPREVVGRGPVSLLTTLEERLMVLDELGVDLVFVAEFTYKFSRLTSREFYDKYIIHGVGVREVIVGYDHTFGRDRTSDTKELRAMGKEFGFEVDVVESVKFEGETISSSKIRGILMQGDVERAGHYLGRPHSFQGTVVEGDRRGATLGFPTANIGLEYLNKILPTDGVYCVQVEFEGKKYFGMLNIGVRPTFQAEPKRIIEVNIFNFNGNIYGKTIRIYFLKHMRAEKNFSSKQELITQLQHDRSECQQYVAATHQP